MPVISTITPLPSAPSSNRPDEFAAEGDAFLAAMETFVTQANAWRTSLETFATMIEASYGSGITAVSTSSVAIGTGSKSLTVSTGKGFVAGQHICLWNQAATAGMFGQVVSYSPSSGAMAVNVISILGAGTHAEWTAFLVPVTSSGIAAPFLPVTWSKHAADIRGVAGLFPGLIQPAFNLFAPNLTLPGTVSFTRASTGWSLSQAPAVKSYTTNAPRFSYDVDGNLLGLRVEGGATRLNTIAAAPVDPENVTVAAVAHTISFYGTGSMILSGAHSATVVGAGEFPTRTSYTFTPAAGTLTLTPSGTVQHLQVETGSFATTPILGEGGPVTRAADVCNVATSGIDFSATEGTLFVAATTAPGSMGQYEYFVRIDDGGSNNQIRIIRAAGVLSARVESGGVNQCILDLGGVANNTMCRIAFSWKANAFEAVLNGGTPVVATSGSIPAVTTIKVGLNFFGAIKHLAYFPRVLTTEQKQIITQ